MPLALDPDAWDRHLDNRRRRRPTLPVEPAFVRVDGVDDNRAAHIVEHLDPELNGVLDPVRFERRLTTLVGEGRFGSLGYDVVAQDDRDGMAVRVREKSHGPPFINLALELDNRADAVEFEFGARLTAYDVGGRDAEARLDVALGSDLRFEAEYLRPLAGSSWFVAPRSSLRSRTQRFRIASDPIASFRTQRARAGVDLGVTLGPSSEVRIGYDVGVLDAGVRVGQPVLAARQGREHGQARGSTPAQRQDSEQQQSHGGPSPRRPAGRGTAAASGAPAARAASSTGSPPTPTRSPSTTSTWGCGRTPTTRT